jgi:hypothetical protein
MDRSKKGKKFESVLKGLKKKRINKKTLDVIDTVPPRRSEQIIVKEAKSYCHQDWDGYKDHVGGHGRKKENNSVPVVLPPPPFKVGCMRFHKALLQFCKMQQTCQSTKDPQGTASLIDRLFFSGQ